MTVEELVKSLEIDKTGTYSDKNNYVIDLESSDEWGKMFSLLDSDEELDMQEDTNVLSEDNSSYSWLYESEDDKTFQISLIANFIEDTYKIVIAEV